MSETEVNLHHGDCFDFLPTLPAGQTAFFFLDLPYATANRKTTAHVWDEPFPLKAMWEQLSRLGRDNAVFIFTAMQPYAADVINSNRRIFRYDLIYHKSSPVGFFNAKRQPMRAHEHVLIFYRKQPCYTPQKTTGAKPYPAVLRKGSNSNYGPVMPNAREANDGTRHPISVLAIKSEGRTISRHPTQKPVALLEWFIRAYTQHGDTLIDPCAGSGTTALAALNVGNRKVICIEKDPAYFEVMSKRVAEHKEKLRLK